jgi:hypothetical protein
MSARYRFARGRSAQTGACGETRATTWEDPGVLAIYGVPRGFSAADGCRERVDDVAPDVEGPRG